MSESKPRSSRAGTWLFRILCLALIAAGVTYAAQPVAVTVWNNYQGTKSVENYVTLVEQIAPAEAEAQREAAQKYNSSLDEKALSDPWDDDAPATSPAHTEYRKQMDALGPMGPLGRVRVPKVDIDLMIRHDATRASMADAAGHMYGTSLPVGGKGTHTVIAAHTGFVGRIFFDRLVEMKEGEYFFIDTYDETLAYKIDKFSIVERTDLSQIKIEKDKDLATLVTCTNHGKLRLLVRGHRVPLAEVSESAMPHGGVVVKKVTTGGGKSQSDPSTKPSADASGEQGGTKTTTEKKTSVATFDYSIQEWMKPRLIVSGAGLLLALGLMVLWWSDDRKARRAARASNGKAA